MAEKFNFKSLKFDEIIDKIEDIVKTIKEDDAFKEKFDDEPVKALEELFNIDLPDEQVEKLVTSIKAKLNLEELGDKVENKVDELIDGIEKIFDRE